MESFQDKVFAAVSLFNAHLSNYALVVILVCVGVFYSVKTRFVQVRCFGEGIRKIFSNMKNGEKGGVSAYQALATAISAQVGTGNIVGASGAILTGGPGAIFWMWIVAFFGMSTIYAEATLAISTRVRGADGETKGGPAYYIIRAFGGGFGKFLAAFFSLAVVLGVGFMGCMVQSNSIGSTMHNAFSIPEWVIGVVLVLLSAFVFFGKTAALVKSTEKIVPVMAVLFLFGSVVALCIRVTHVPEAFSLIFRYAFTPQAIIGGSFGSAIKIALSQGVKRGLFSNEAGMGTTPHAHALADVKKPHDQGTVAMIGVFFDTFVVLTINALVIITALYTKGGILENGAVPVWIGKANLAQVAFGSIFADVFGAEGGRLFGEIFVAVCLFFFAYSTALSWNYFGKVNAIYLFGKRNERRCAAVYSLVSITFVFVGTLLSNDLVWELQDMLNNLMVIPNALALFTLSGIVVKCVAEGKS